MKLVGATSQFRPWSQEEKQLLAEAYARGGLEEARRSLPERSVDAIYHAADRLGIERRRRWSVADDDLLRNLWGAEVRLRVIAKRLGRTQVATYWRAQKLGLPLGCPDGWEYLADAAERTGYGSAEALARILRWAGVEIERATARPSRRHRKRPTHIVCPELVDNAIARWHETETLEFASRRTGVCAETIRRWLAAIGVELPKKRDRTHLRVLSVDVDRALAERKLAMGGRKAAPRFSAQRRVA